LASLSKDKIRGRGEGRFMMATATTIARDNFEASVCPDPKGKKRRTRAEQPWLAIVPARAKPPIRPRRRAALRGGAIRARNLPPALSRATTTGWLR